MQKAEFWPAKEALVDKTKNENSSIKTGNIEFWPAKEALVDKTRNENGSIKIGNLDQSTIEMESDAEPDLEDNESGYKFQSELYVNSKINKGLATISWNVNATVRIKPSKNVLKKIKKNLTKKKSGDKNQIIKILDNVQGVVKPGQICAIMGASGAGKTSLLNILNFRNSKQINAKDSEIKINGKIMTWKDITKYSGYVQQVDLFIGTMTVKEHLTFLSELKMGRDFTKEEKRARVNEVISQVSLTKAQDTFIGQGDQLKGISGGEKRRLAFACEILTYKSILFCDEPTSGLDAYMANGLVNLMRNLANSGKTIICTIHQPSTQTFKKFDTLCLLSEGRVAYFGPSLDYMCPTTYNPADFFIKTLAIMPDSREESLKRAKSICDAYERSEFKQHLEKEIQSSSKLNNDDSFVDKHTYAATALVQTRWLLWRNFTNDRRQPITKILLVQTIFISIFFGLIYLRLANNEVGANDRNGLVFLLMMNGGFIFLFPILNVFTGEMPIYYRDNKNKLYSTFIYYVSKQLAEFPKYSILNGILTTIIYWMSGLNDNFGVFLEFLLIFQLQNQAGISFAYFISAASSSIEIGSALAAPILIPLILFAGFFISNDTVPVYFIWLKYISWYYYCYDALMIVLWRGVGSIPCSKSNQEFNSNFTNMSDYTVNFDGNYTLLMDKNATCSNSTSRCYENGKDVLDLYFINTENLARDIILIFVLAFVMRVLGYVCLVIRAKRK